MHNHPSGDCISRKEDDAVTNMLSNARDLLGINVLDHVIIGRYNFTSLKENGILS